MTENSTLPMGLTLASAYLHEVEAITVLETPISWLILTGKWAYKIKKPHCLPFVDYSTLAKRRFYCQEELRLNRRFTPELYLDVVPVCRVSGQLKVAAEQGDIVDYAVKMRQFKAGSLWAELADNGDLQVGAVEALALRLTQVQASLPIASAESDWAEPALIRAWALANFRELAAILGDRSDDTARLKRLAAWTDNEGWPGAAVFAQRKRKGAIREGHGDLHLANITCDQGQVVLFDAIEFNPQLRWLDVLSELAFPVMDLTARQQPALANHLLNAYLQVTGDYAGLCVYRFYYLYRAMVRAKVAALAGQSTLLERYLNTAEQVLERRRPVMVVMMGFSGAGKSVLARQLAAALDMIVLRSDVERKRLYQIPALSRNQLDKSILYSAAASDRVFKHLQEQAEALLVLGYSVVIDAAMLHEWRRLTFKHLAEKVGAPAWLVQVTAPEAVLIERLKARQTRDDDPSDADVSVMQQQMSNWQAPDEWPKHRCVTVTCADQAQRMQLIQRLREAMTAGKDSG
ncbi:MAG: AAA family ATPase [Methylococcales bacterium]|nr:AAA family ATPase [Methylococcales bacterium]